MHNNIWTNSKVALIGFWISTLHMWADHRLPISIKIRLYRTAVCSSFTHACEAWTLVKSVQRKINGFNSRCLSRITGEDFAETATHPLFDLVAVIIKRRLRFAGHILRMGPDRLLHRTFISYMCSSGSNTRPPDSLLHTCARTCQLKMWQPLHNTENSGLRS